MKHIIVVSPIPSHPQFQGNSARIFRLTKMLQQANYKVHFVYFGMEGLSPTQKKEMSECWDYFYFVKPEGAAATPSFIDFFDIDDWYDEKVSTVVESIVNKFSIAICLTNYVWFSKVLSVVPQNVTKIIDTHDVFGDRHIIARNAGMEPVWFYTSKELEAKALARADLILAIQDEEQEYFESISDTPVEVMGYLTPINSVLQKTIDWGKEKPKIGYIGSGNPFNVQSVLRLQSEIKSNIEIIRKFDFVVAGTICKNIENENDVFNLFGMVEHLEDFYREVDIVINPMLGGTGLKIKSLEALSFQKPLIATTDAMVGIPSSNKFQKCSDLQEVVFLLSSFNESDFYSLKDDSHEVFSEYNLRHLETFKRIFN